MKKQNIPQYDIHEPWRCWDMRKPLTKGEFLLYETEKWRICWAMLWLIIGAVGIVSVIWSTYELVTSQDYFTIILRLLVAIALFVLSKVCSNKAHALRQEELRIQEQMSQNNKAR